MTDIKTFLDNLEQQMNNIGLKEVDFIDLNTVNNTLTDRYYTVIQNMNVTKSDLTSCVWNVRLGILIVLDKNNWFLRTNDVMEIFTNDDKIRTLTQNTNIFSVAVNTITTSEKAYVSKGVEVVSLGVSIAFLVSSR